MNKPKCVIQVRPDLTAVICAWCQREESRMVHVYSRVHVANRPGDEWAESRGYSVSHGMCEEHYRKEKDSMNLLRSCRSQLEKL